jgi:hypothetical protein
MNCVSASELLLRTRAREILSYLRFLRIAVEKNATVTASASSGQLQHRMPRNLTYTLKANLYLLLYSAMEATFIQLIDDIHEVVGNNTETVDSLHSDLFLQVVSSFKQSRVPITSHEVQTPIGAAVMSLWCKEWRSKTKGKEKRTGELSGNVDGLSMHKHLRRYGVVTGTDKNPLPHLTHKALQYSKDRRNMLAHGELGFAELGSSYSVEELIADARGVFKTLVRISQQVNSYLDAKGYLKDSSWHSQPQ